MTQGPIFILGIQRGGTNQFLNILRSHPDTFWPQGEFHEVFRTKGLRRDGLRGAFRRWRGYAPVRRGVGDILDPDRPPAARLTGARGAAVRAGLEGSARINAPGVMAYKKALARESLIEPNPAPDRLLVKVMNYNLAFAEDLLALYPGARLVGVIRDGRGVCEGHVARGARLEDATAVYNFVAHRLIELEEAGAPIRTWRFEDLIGDAEGVASAVLDFCGLGLEAMRGVCLQDKERRTDNTGRVVGIDKVAQYYTFAQMGDHMRRDANAASRARLPREQQAQIAETCAGALARFGYDGS